MPLACLPPTTPADTDGDALTSLAADASAGGGELRTTWLLVLSIGTFALGVDGFVLSGLLPQLSADLHLSVGTAGQLTTLFALVYAVGGVDVALTGAWALAITAVVIGALGVGVAALIHPEHTKTKGQ